MHRTADRSTATGGVPTGAPEAAEVAVEDPFAAGAPAGDPLQTAVPADDPRARQWEEAALVRQARRAAAVIDRQMFALVSGLRRMLERGHTPEGWLGVESWLSTLGLAGWQAKRLAALAALLRHLPCTYGLWADGTVGWPHIETIFHRTKGLEPDELEIIDRELSATAHRWAEADADWVADQIDRLIARLDHHRATGRVAYRVRRRALVMAPFLDGSGGSLHGVLDPIGFAAVGQALDAAAGTPEGLLPGSDGSERRHNRFLWAHARADALVTLLSATLPEDTIARLQQLAHQQAADGGQDADGGKGAGGRQRGPAGARGAQRGSADAHRAQGGTAGAPGGPPPLTVTHAHAFLEGRGVDPDTVHGGRDAELEGGLPAGVADGRADSGPQRDGTARPEPAPTDPADDPTAAGATPQPTAGTAQPPSGGVVGSIPTIDQMLSAWDRVARTPLLIVSCHDDDLDRGLLRLHTSLGALPIPAGALHRTIHQTGADVRAILADSLARPVELGSRRRLAPPALRQALLAIYRRCVAPGCTRAAARCDLHHIHPAHQGGRTHLRNLVPLCRTHHTQTTDGRLRITRTPQGVLRIWPKGRPDRAVELPSDLATLKIYTTLKAGWEIPPPPPEPPPHPQLDLGWDQGGGPLGTGREGQPPAADAARGGWAGRRPGQAAGPDRRSDPRPQPDPATGQTHGGPAGQPATADPAADRGPP